VVVGRGLFPNLNGLITCGQGCFDERPKVVKNRQQVSRAAVSQTNPDESSTGLYAAGQMNEIRVLGDEDLLRLACATPDLKVCNLGQAGLGDMQAFRASRGEKSAQSNRELVINQESHYALSTEWSVW